MPEIIAKLDSPAAIGGLPGTGYAKAVLDHIPGSVLRGAVAAAWIQSGRPTDEQFLNAFERDVHWGPLHLAGSGPTPMSWWAHKYRPGAACPRAWDESAGDVPAACPMCGDPLERAKGAVTGVAVASQTHVQLQDGTAVDGQLFMRRQIQAGQAFRGRVDALTLQSTAAVAEALSLVGLGPGRPATVWLGGRRSTDRGRATLTLGSQDPPTLVAKPNRLVFMLLSPGIFVDDAGAATAQPREDELSEVLGVPAKVQRRWSRWTTVGGWNAAARMPKPSERAAATGSVYLVGTSSPASPDALDRLARRGVGLRRTEGYGSVAALPALPRSEAQLGSSLAALNVLRTRPKLMAALLEEMRGRAAQLAAGSQLTPMGLVGYLKKSPPNMLRSLSLTDGTSIAAAADVLDGLRDPHEMQAALRGLGAAS